MPTFWLELMVVNDRTADPVMIARALLDEQWGFGLARVVKELSRDGDGLDFLGDVQHAAASDEELVERLAVAVACHQHSLLEPNDWQEHQMILERIKYLRGVAREISESPDTEWSEIKWSKTDVRQI